MNIYTLTLIVTALSFSTIPLSDAIVIFRSNSFSSYFVDAPARFAVGLNSSGICGELHLADPMDACSSLLNEVRSATTHRVRVALIVRGKCAFDDKILNAQKAGFDAAIVYDDQSKRGLVSMSGNSEDISIHAVFVTNTAGVILKQHVGEQGGECCIYSSAVGATWTVLGISFISLLVIISVLATFFVTRNRRVHWQASNHHGRSSLDPKEVEILPCVMFSSAHHSGCQARDTCTICLEDYKEGERLRVLPCQHEFHASCVDSWLTKWGTCCPVCKHEMR